MQYTEERIRRIKIDSLYGKKKHFNAADRKEKYHYWIGIPLIIINIMTGTLLFKTLTNNEIEWVKYIPIWLAFISSFLSGFQTYFNFNKKVEGHRRIATRYLSIMKRADRLQAYIKDDIITNEILLKDVESMAKEVEAINTDAEQFPTSQADYSKAKKGIENGDEDYTEKELSL